MEQGIGFFPMLMSNKLITIDDARKRLGKRAEKMTDEEIEKVLNMFRFICNRVIDSVVDKKNSN